MPTGMLKMDALAVPRCKITAFAAAFPKEVLRQTQRQKVPQLGSMIAQTCLR
jgi:hypothetical protein